MVQKDKEITIDESGGGGGGVGVKGLPPPPQQMGIYPIICAPPQADFFFACHHRGWSCIGRRYPYLIMKGKKRKRKKKKNRNLEGEKNCVGVPPPPPPPPGHWIPDNTMSVAYIRNSTWKHGGGEPGGQRCGRKGRVERYWERKGRGTVAEGEGVAPL